MSLSIRINAFLFLGNFFSFFFFLFFFIKQQTQREHTKAKNITSKNAAHDTTQLTMFHDFYSADCCTLSTEWYICMYTFK